MPKKNKLIPKIATQNISNRGRGIPQNATDKKIPREKKWEFSFQYWEQIKYFGLKHQEVDTRWFVSLLKRLKDLSSEHLEGVLRDGAKRKVHRIHSINWDLSSIPKHTFYNHIPKEYQTDETDIIQFQIEKSKGRVVGFLDFNSTFQVVLLDPVHNMQLSKHNDRKKTKTEIFC